MPADFPTTHPDHDLQQFSPLADLPECPTTIKNADHANPRIPSPPTSVTFTSSNLSSQHTMPLAPPLQYTSAYSQPSLLPVRASTTPYRFLRQGVYQADAAMLASTPGFVSRLSNQKEVVIAPAQKQSRHSGRKLAAGDGKILNTGGLYPPGERVKIAAELIESRSNGARYHEVDIQFWINLCLVEITSSECFLEVRSLLNCPSKIALARSFQGREAQTFIDFLDQVLMQSRLDKKLQQRSLRLIRRICEARGIVPSSYTLRGDHIHVGEVQYHGGFSDVSDGEYQGCAVAIKHLKTNKGGSDRIFKRFCREIIAWKHLSHPNILPLLGVSISANTHRFHILTEWMPNGNIMQYAESNPAANRLRVLSEVMSGVAYLHDFRIVHGDIKGANILVDNMGTARVADFGLMTITDLTTTFLSETDGSPGGTYCRMSPELLDPKTFGSSGRSTRESDCYALGMLIYEVLTGLRPFYHVHACTPIPAILRGERPEKPSQAESLGFSDTLWGLVQLCWSEMSSTRPTAQELLDHLSFASPKWIPPTVYPVIVTDSSRIFGLTSSGSFSTSITGSA